MYTVFANMKPYCIKDDVIVTPLIKWYPCNNSIILAHFDQIDYILNTVKDFFKIDKTSKLVIIHDWSPAYINGYADILKEIIGNFHMLPSQLYFIMLDMNQVEQFKTALKDRGIGEVNIEARNHLLIDQNPIYEAEENITNKFSLCIRSYRPWRLHFFVKLIENNLLDDFVYTFSHIEPFLPIKTEQEHDKTLLKNLDFVRNSSKKDYINKWIDNMPYLVGQNINDVFSLEVFKLIKCSHINIVLETHIEEQMIFITEKTGKAIACKKPFIIFGVAGSYEWVRKLGFKTFHPFIDETFDLITDSNVRQEKIIMEIERINNLPTNLLVDLLYKCRPIIEYNFKRLLKIKQHKYSQPFTDLNIFR